MGGRGFHKEKTQLFPPVKSYSPLVWYKERGCGQTRKGVVGLGGVVIPEGVESSLLNAVAVTFAPPPKKNLLNIFFIQSAVMDGVEAGHHSALSAARRAPPTKPPLFPLPAATRR